MKKLLWAVPLLLMMGCQKTVEYNEPVITVTEMAIDMEGRPMVILHGIKCNRYVVFIKGRWCEKRSDAPCINTQ